MAVDKKSQHVGNHGGTYTDIDGMSKQFTYIDHDKKSKMSFFNNCAETRKWSEKGYKADLVERITELPASICPEIFCDYTIRGEGKRVVEWNTDMLIDAGVPTNQLRDLCTLLENKAELMRLIPQI